jgi:TonB family protein
LPRGKFFTQRRIRRAVFLERNIAVRKSEVSFAAYAIALKYSRSQTLAPRGSDRMIHGMNTSPIRSDWTGRDVDGRFPLLEWLGGSESSGVYVTELDANRSPKAVVKLIAASTRDAETQIDCWATTKNISHPNLMPLAHTGRSQVENVSLLYAVTPFAEEVLSGVLAERPLTPVETEQMVAPVIDALAYLHKNGLVHGRLKPANIMVVDDQLKISSDRLQAASERGNALPAPTVFDSPEFESGTISPAADVWSLGITIIQALTQRPPIWDRMHRTEPIMPRSIPQPFAEIAHGCLRSDPERRFTLSDVKARLGLAQTNSVPAAKPGKNPPLKLGTPALVVGLLALGCVVAVLQLRSHPTQPPAAEQPDAAQPNSSDSASPPGPVIAKPSAAQRASTEASPLVPPTPETHSSQADTGNGEILRRVEPNVLPSAIESIQGKVDVSVRVRVDQQGEVLDATLDAPGSSRYFARVAVDAAKEWKFKPAQEDSQAAPSVWILQFEFTQSGTEITPFKVSP